LKASTAHRFWSPPLHASAVTFSRRYSEVLISVVWFVPFLINFRNVLYM
jgi:hypothetical protein